MREHFEIHYPVYCIGPARLAPRGPVGAALQFPDDERGRCLMIFESIAKAQAAIYDLQTEEPFAIMQIDDRKELDTLFAAHEKCGATMIAWNWYCVEGQPKAFFIDVREWRAGLAFYLAMD